MAPASTPSGRTGAPAEGRSARKHRQILEAARATFLAKGFAAASMDEVAARAAVSKQTVYKHFVDKRSLFTEIVTADIGAAEARTADDVAALGASDDVERDLRAFARRHVDDVTDPDLLRLRRVVVAEADRFPEIARAWYEQGPGRGHAALAEQFAALGARGRLRVEDPLLAAQHFNWLVVGVPLNESLFRVGDLRDRDRRRLADEGVRVFLAAYGVRERPTR